MSKSLFRESIIHDPTLIAKQIEFEKTVSAVNVKVKVRQDHGLNELFTIETNHFILRFYNYLFTFWLFL
jgi:hypothetical protein